MAPDNNPTLYDEIISELKEMPQIEILYHCAEEMFTDTRYLAPVISSRKTIVVKNEKYTSTDSKKKHTVNPLNEIEHYLSKKDTIGCVMKEVRHIDILREQDDSYHKVSIYHAKDEEDAETIITQLFK